MIYVGIVSSFRWGLRHRPRYEGMETCGVVFSFDELLGSLRHRPRYEGMETGTTQGLKPASSISSETPAPL